jgi:hypothetical protein
MSKSDRSIAQSKVSDIVKTFEVESNEDVKHTFTLRSGETKTLITGDIPNFSIADLPLDFPIHFHCEMLPELRKIGYPAPTCGLSLQDFIKIVLRRHLYTAEYKKRLEEFGPVSKKYFLAATQDASGMSNEASHILNTMDILIIMKIIDLWANGTQMYSLIEKTSTVMETLKELSEDAKLKILTQMPNYTGRKLTMYFKLMFPPFEVFVRECLSSAYIIKKVMQK